MKDIAGPSYAMELGWTGSWLDVAANDVYLVMVQEIAMGENGWGRAQHEALSLGIASVPVAGTGLGISIDISWIVA